MKVVVGLVVVVILALAGAGVYLFYFAGDVVERGIEKYGPQYLGTSVDVGNVDMDFAQGRGVIQNLTVGNPTGFSGPYSMRLGSVDMILDTANSSSEVVVVKQILIDGASLAVAAVGKNTNLQKLMDNIEAAVGPSETGTTAPEESGPETKFIVDKFSFTNADVSLTSDILGARQITIPAINLQGVGRKTNGATAAELVEQLLQPITAAVSRAAVSEGLDIEGVKGKLVDKVRDKLPGVDKLKDLF